MKKKMQNQKKESLYSLLKLTMTTTEEENLKKLIFI